jgi:TRAP-type C4-dicarboxylate transport system permease small subunit
VTGVIVRRLLDGLYLAAGWLAGLGLVAIGALMMAMSLGREFSVNVRGGDEIASWLCAAVAYLGLAHTFKSGDLVRVGMLVESLKGRPRRLAECAVLLVAAVITGYFAWYCIDLLHDSWRFRERTQGVISIPIWIPQIGLAAGAVILFLAVIDELVRVLSGGDPSYVKPEPTTVEEVIQRAESSGV